MILSTRVAILSIVSALFVSHTARAADEHKGHDHDSKKGSEHAHDAKALYGGIVSVVNDVNYELVVKPDRLTLYVSDHGKPVDTKGAVATLILLSPAGKSEVKLVPAGDNKFQAQGAFTVPPGTKVAASVKLRAKSENVKFTVK